MLFPNLTITELLLLTITVFFCSLSLAVCFLSFEFLNGLMAMVSILCSLAGLGLLGVCMARILKS